MSNQQPPIVTNRLSLSPIADTDIHHVYSGLSNPKVIKHYGVSYDSLEATRAQMEWFAKAEQCWWAIRSADNQTFYGAGGINDIDYDTGTAEIGLWLLPPFWGKGIMTEAMPLITNYGMEELGLTRIEGFVESENTGCKRALAKLDFRYERTIEETDPETKKVVMVDVYATTKP
ncbi:GNAT family N-acetyltransferase [Lewinellaceae bacterium SD302]|nr:GNAT family N-acetyltransferase [Lewinellaceae bacterium SD302]